MSKEKKPKSPLGIVFLTVFIDLLGVGILIPVIPQLLANPASQYYLLPNGWTIDQGFILLGFLTAIFPFMQFVATPILGQLSDKFGRKPVLAISLAGTALSYALFAIGIITRNLPLLFFSRALDGVTGGNISVAQAAIADTTTPENRSKAFGMIGAAFGLGFILGPYIGGKLSDPSVVSWFDATVPFWFAVILSLINVLSVVFRFPETNQNIDKVKKIEWNKSLHNIGKAIAAERLRIVFLTLFVFNAGFTFFTTFASVFFIERFGWSQGNIGDFFAYIGIWSVVSQILVIPRVMKKYREDQVMKFSLFGMALGLFGYFLAQESWQILLIAPIASFFNGLTFASSMGLVSKSADPKIQGEVLGISTSVQALAQAIPAALTGFIAAGLSANSPLLVAVASLILAGVVFVFFYKYDPSHTYVESTEPALAH